MRNITVRSTPMPNAKPVYSFGSMPQAASTRGLTMPQPPHSIQPSERQVRQGRSGLPTESPCQTKHSRSTSADGSVKGKKCGRILVFTSPNMARARWSSVPRRSAMEMPLSMTRPSS